MLWAHLTKDLWALNWNLVKIFVIILKFWSNRATNLLMSKIVVWCDNYCSNWSSMTFSRFGLWAHKLLAEILFFLNLIPVKQNLNAVINCLIFMKAVAHVAKWTFVRGIFIEPCLVIYWLEHVIYWSRVFMHWTVICTQPMVALTHWGWDKMATIFQTTFSNAFSWMKMYEFRLRFHWSLFLRFQLTISQHWFW